MVCQPFEGLTPTVQTEPWKRAVAFRRNGRQHSRWIVTWRAVHNILDVGIEIAVDG
jgi:hypothetical protein